MELKLKRKDETVGSILSTVSSYARNGQMGDNESTLNTI